MAPRNSSCIFLDLLWVHANLALNDIFDGQLVVIDILVSAHVPTHEALLSLNLFMSCVWVSNELLLRP